MINMTRLINLKINYYYVLPLIVIIANLIIFNRFFQPSEGWWQTFGYLINKGQEPYSDFNSAITPAFMYFNSILLNIFGEKLILFRVFGIATVLTTILLLQWLLSKLTNRNSAAIAVFSAFALNMSTPVFLPYDYSSYIDILLVLSLVLYYLTLKSESLYKAVTYTFSLGCILALILFMKQNIGLFFGLATFVGLIVWKKSYVVLHVLSLITGYVLVFYGFSLLIDLNAVWEGLFLNNDAKGSVITVLFRFILDLKSLLILLASILLVSLLVMISKYKAFILSSKYWKKLNNIKILNFLYIASIALYLLIFFNITPFRYLFETAIFIITIGVFLYLIYQLIIKGKNDSEFNKFILPIVALAYSTTHTAGYNFIGMYFVVAFSLAYLFYKIKLSKKTALIYLAVILLMTNLMISNIKEPYNWWGLTQGDIFSSKYETNYEQLAGIKVDKKTRDFFNTVKFNIEKYSKSDDDVYLFPHIPIFYLLHHKTPPVKSIIQWYDFATTKQLEEDLKVLKTDLPNVIVWLDPPAFVKIGHSNMLDHQIIQEQYDDLFYKLITEGDFEVVHTSGFIDIEEQKAHIIESHQINLLAKIDDIDDIIDLVKIPKNRFKIQEVHNANFATGDNPSTVYNTNLKKYSNHLIIDLDVEQVWAEEAISNIGVINHEKKVYRLKILVKKQTY